MPISTCSKMFDAQKLGTLFPKLVRKNEKDAMFTLSLKDFVYA